MTILLHIKEKIALHDFDLTLFLIFEILCIPDIKQQDPPPLNQKSSKLYALLVRHESKNYHLSVDKLTKKKKETKP